MTNIADFYIAYSVAFWNCSKKIEDKKGSFNFFYNFLRYPCLETGNVTKAQPYLPYLPNGTFRTIFRDTKPNLDKTVW